MTIATITKVLLLLAFLTLGVSGEEKLRGLRPSEQTERTERQIQACDKDSKFKLAQGLDDRPGGSGGAVKCGDQERRPEVFVLAGIAHQMIVDQIEGETLAPAGPPTSKPTLAPTKRPSGKPTKTPTKAPTTPRPSSAPNTPRPTSSPVPQKDTCDSSIYWPTADGDRVVICRDDSFCTNYKPKFGTPCCSVPRCICSSTAVTGVDRCGNF